MALLMALPMVSLSGYEIEVNLLSIRGLYTCTDPFQCTAVRTRYNKQLQLYHLNHLHFPVGCLCVKTLSQVIQRDVTVGFAVPLTWSM